MKRAGPSKFEISQARAQSKTASSHCEHRVAGSPWHGGGASCRAELAQLTAGDGTAAPVVNFATVASRVASPSTLETCEIASTPGR